jgi:hypothetical protein
MADFRNDQQDKAQSSEAQRKKDLKKKESGGIVGKLRPSNPGLSSDPREPKADREKRKKREKDEYLRAQAQIDLDSETQDEDQGPGDFPKNLQDRQRTGESYYDKYPQADLKDSSDTTEKNMGSSDRADNLEEFSSAEDKDVPFTGPPAPEDPLLLKLRDMAAEGLTKLIVELASAMDKYTSNAERSIVKADGKAYKSATAVGMKLTTKQLVATSTNKAALSGTLKTIDKNESVGPYNRSQYSFDQNLSRLANVWSVGTNASQEPPDPDDERFWRDLEDCIPCMQWTWGEMDVLWDDLTAIFQADLDARISIFQDLSGLFEGSPILDELCEILKMFQNLCPQDLLALIAMLVVRTIQILQSMRTDLGGMLKDIISTFLRPTINGLAGFLNMYATFLWDQVDCILNIIQTTSEVMSQAHVAMPWADDKKNWLDHTAEGMQGTDDWVRNKAIPAAAGLPDQLTKFTIGTVNKSMTYLGDKLDMMLDLILETCRIDFVRSDKELGFQANLMAVATMIDIAKIFKNWYDNGSDFDLCSEEGASTLIDTVNRSIPNINVVNVDANVDRRMPGDTVPRRTPGRTPNPALPEGQPTSSADTGRSRVEFSIKSCLNTSNSSEADLLSRWAGEL